MYKRKILKLKIKLNIKSNPRGHAHLVIDHGLDAGDRGIRFDVESERSVHLRNPLDEDLHRSEHWVNFRRKQNNY